MNTTRLETSETVRDLRAWARSRLDVCRTQETKFVDAWALSDKHGRGPPQALVEAWTERRTLQAVLGMLDEGVESPTGSTGT